MKRIIFMMCISLAFVMALNWRYPAESPEIVIEKEPFADIASPKQYRFYDAEVVMKLYGRTLFRDLTYDVGQLFFMSTRDDALWDSGDIVAIADNKSQLDSNPPIKGGKVALREKRPGIPKVYYEILTPFIEKDVENGVELIMLDYSAAENLKENEWFVEKLTKALPIDSAGRITIPVYTGKVEYFEKRKQEREVNNAVHYELITSDVTEDSFRFSVKKYTDVDNFKVYNGKARMKNGKWQYKMGLWWKTVEN
ncbi:MAG: hypothetical protein IKU13_06945 [Clostridia bacterium]|nr:hypothetical protein [Clostridia bacterium]